MPLLSVEGLTKRFAGLVAVDGVGFAVEPGDILGLIGPNGAGKTTLLNLIGGDMVPTRGRILHRGSDIQGTRPAAIARRGIGRTFQRTSVFANVSVRENVLIGTHLTSSQSFLRALLRGETWRREESSLRMAAAEVIDVVGLSGRAETLARNLPYGDQRRLSVAVALASNPELLLMDEPAAGMTGEDVNHLAGLIRRIRDRGTTVILVEHNMRMVMDLCSRLHVLDQGRTIADGPPAEIRRHARVIEVYLGREPARARD